MRLPFLIGWSAGSARAAVLARKSDPVGERDVVGGTRRQSPMSPGVANGAAKHHAQGRRLTDKSSPARNAATTDGAAANGKNPPPLARGAG